MYSHMYCEKLANIRREQKPKKQAVTVTAGLQCLILFANSGPLWLVIKKTNFASFHITHFITHIREGCHIILSNIQKWPFFLSGFICIKPFPSDPNCC